jgi:hypothetical protein
MSQSHLAKNYVSSRTIEKSTYIRFVKNIIKLQFKVDPKLYASIFFQEPRQEI